MKRLTSINVASVFKMSLVLGASAGLLAGLLLLVSSLFEKNYKDGLLTLALAPVLYGLLGAVVNSVLAWVYNLAASSLGGIEVSFDD
jgi:hypothetical protein